MIGIYKITNNINGHAYIGQSIDIDRRFRGHKNYPMEASNYPLYCAFKKYGIDNFSFEVVEECLVSELDEKEIYYINKYDTYNTGYNQTTGGQTGNSNNCIKISKEDIQIIYDLLLHSTMTQREIAKQFNVGEDTISEINQGKTRICDTLSYPLRKNKHEQNYCAKCGVPILHESTYCPKCSKIMRRVVERPEREELKKLIRTVPFTKIGEQFGVSDKAIVKWCIQANLPSKKKDIKNYSNEEWEKI